YSAASLMTLPPATVCTGAAFFAGEAPFGAGCWTALGAVGCGTTGACWAAAGATVSAAMNSQAASQDGRVALTPPRSNPHIRRCGAMQGGAPMLSTAANSATGS